MTPNRIKENFDVFDLELDDADMASIAQVNTGNRPGPNPRLFAMR